MPRAARERIRRHVDSARSASDRALVHLSDLREIFGPHHPEYLPLFDALGQMQIMFQVSLGDLYEKAWGRRPKEYPRLSVDYKTGMLVPEEELYLDDEEED